MNGTALRKPTARRVVGMVAVSYTHLDVYKRQPLTSALFLYPEHPTAGAEVPAHEFPDGKQDVYKRQKSGEAPMVFQTAGTSLGPCGKHLHLVLCCGGHIPGAGAARRCV